MYHYSRRNALSLPQGDSMDKLRHSPPYSHHSSLQKKGLLAQEMLVLRWQGRPAMLRRVIVILASMAMILCVFSFYQAIETSYLDLVDALIPDTSIEKTEEGAAASITTTHDISLSPTREKPFVTPPAPERGNSCNDDSRWIEEWISSGRMPKCSLAHRATVDVVYTYTHPLPGLIPGGSTVPKSSIKNKRRNGRTSPQYTGAPRKPQTER